MGHPKSPRSAGEVTHFPAADAREDVLRLSKLSEAELSYSTYPDSSVSGASSSQTEQLKAELKSLLRQHNGSTKHPEVVRVCQELSKQYSSQSKTTNDFDEELFLGDFIALTCPNFPGRLPTNKDGDDSIVQYTLGRLSFKIFQPNSLVCTLRSVRNPVSKCLQNDSSGGRAYQYPLILDITIHTPGGDLDAMLINKAIATPHDSLKGRLNVKFSGGTLMPSRHVKEDPQKWKLWKATFEHAYETAHQQRSYLGRMVQYVIQMVLGLTLPDDDDSAFSFDMKRSPTGHLDVLYLDEDLRITKGNRGTLVVVERQAKEADGQ